MRIALIYNARQADGIAVCTSKIVIGQKTALEWARADRRDLERAIPGLSRRITLARRVDWLLARLQEMMRERLHWQRPAPQTQQETDLWSVARRSEADGLEASLQAADLVICQVGCLSHGAYWRVQDHCKRTGKACVLVAQPNALRIVRLTRVAGAAREQMPASRR